MNEKHEFAFFTEEVAQLTRNNQEYSIRDATAVRRLVVVLRAQPGDRIILFDVTHHIACTLVNLKKQEVTVRVDARAENKSLQPSILFLLPLLEREAFEESLEALTVMGATEIIPVVTQKSRKKWGDVKEGDRARRLMIAAAEQSKQFALPKIHETIDIKSALAKQARQKDSKIFFDAQGKPAFDVLQTLQKNRAEVVALIGPEGDLTAAEKTLVQEHGFVFCKLTPTILRASTAVEVGMGLLRSCII